MFSPAIARSHSRNLDEVFAWMLPVLLPGSSCYLCTVILTADGVRQWLPEQCAAIEHKFSSRRLDAGCRLRRARALTCHNLSSRSVDPDFFVWSATNVQRVYSIPSSSRDGGAGGVNTRKTEDINTGSDSTICRSASCRLPYAAVFRVWQEQFGSLCLAAVAQELLEIKDRYGLLGLLR